MPIRHILPALAAAALTALASAPAAPAAPTGEVIVRFAADAGAGDRRDARSDVAARVVETIAPRTQVLDVDGSAAGAARELDRRGDVVWAEANATTKALWLPNDPRLGDQWHIRNTGQLGGIAGADIDLDQAWDLQPTATGVKLGVVDTGVHWANPDLGGFWTNTREIAGNRLDDDANGCVDDVRGCDFINGDGDPADDEGHGTGVTSIAAARTHNGVGMAGVAVDATLLQAKVLDHEGYGTNAALAAGIRYAAANGAKVVNLSIGGPFSNAVLDAINAHPNVLFVAAAGNETRDNDVQPSYPCAFTVANVLCVGASTSADKLASFSNWGRLSVDLLAPGQGILGSTLDSSFASWSGTSMSAPLTAGVAALLLAHRPNATVAQLKQAILDGATPVAAFAGKSVTGARLDAVGALRAIERAVDGPAPVTHPTIAGTARVGQTLTADAGTWSGSPAPALALQWQRCDSGGGACQPVSGATGASHALTGADAGATLRVRVTATNPSGQAASTTAATPVVTAPAPAPVPAPAPAPAPQPAPEPSQPVAVAPLVLEVPSISGTVRVGALLTAGQGTWTAEPSTTFSVSWQRCDARGANCRAISRATGFTYRPATADAGHRLRLRVGAFGPGGTTVAFSQLTSVVGGRSAVNSRKAGSRKKARSRRAAARRKAIARRKAAARRRAAARSKARSREASARSRARR